MDKNKRLGMLFDAFAEQLNISDTLYERAVRSYTALADYIKENNKTWTVEIFPQGSFELGTVVKPVNDEDEYDVDLVILVKLPKFDDPKKLRDTIKSFLESHGRYEGKIEEKKQALRVVYSDSAQFHMDVVCATSSEKIDVNIINIAKQNETLDGYFFGESNPKGYMDWFKKTMNYERLLQEAKTLYRYSSTEIEKLTLFKMRTPLQKAIQVLKRHRDIYFKNNLDNRPSSIIITTLCALAYDNTNTFRSENDNVYLTIKKMLETFYIYLGGDSNGEYNLSNPSFKSENFLYKWNFDKTLKENFDKWIVKAKEDIITNPEMFIDEKPDKLRFNLLESLGAKSMQSALDAFGLKIKSLNEKGEIGIDKRTLSATISAASSSTIFKPKSNTFYGDIDAKS